MSTLLSQTPTLLRIPLELQSFITSHLSIPDLLALRLTCTHFETTISPPSHQDLLTTEQTPWAMKRRLYSCMDCLRLRPTSKFADAMKKGKKGLNGKEPHKRFCVDCGIKPKMGQTRYSPGAEIVVDGERRVFCNWCRKWKGGSEAGCPGSRECKACHGNEKLGCGFCRKGEVVESIRRNKSRRKRGWISWDSDDELPDEYDEYFWECYDPAD